MTVDQARRVWFHTAVGISRIHGRTLTGKNSKPVLLLEYRNRQYEIDGAWNDENGVLSVWFPLESITDEQWEEREQRLCAYIAHHIGEHATIEALELLRTDVQDIAALHPLETRLAVLQARYEPRAIEDVSQIASLGYEALGLLPPSQAEMLIQDIQQHALSAAGRGIEITFHGFLRFRSAGEARSARAA